MKLLLIILFMLVFNRASSQVTINNTSCSVSESNLLFRGGENILSVQGIEAGKNISLASSGEQNIQRIGKNQFLLRGSQAAYDTIKVKVNNKIVLTKIFNVVIASDPTAVIGNFPDSILSVSKFWSTLN